MSLPIHDPRHPWNRLTTVARSLADDRGARAPFGFATRVAALAMGREVRTASLFDVFALKALGIACLLAAGSVALNFSEVSRRLGGSSSGGTVGEDPLLAGQDAVAIVLALAD